jgi:DNA invertase Pin-like site-specific DNA recombinase
MNRPALKQLLEDIQNDKVDTIVVYKVDRLTRSLADFAKLVEILDAHHVSFVSVTQQFNTTTSMGRLTLNVLLSFAQFEREVTGERIRDKIAASKRKGMWMGGLAPVGYDLEDRKLVVNRHEAELVVTIYQQYLALGCVSELKRFLDEKGLKSKLRINRDGKKFGGGEFSRGALYQILRNRIYLGEIFHLGQAHTGQHAAIISRELWQKVETRLSATHQGRRNGLKSQTPSLLTGIFFDSEGHRLTPSHAVKGKKRYRYYFKNDGRGAVGKSPLRLPAHEVESRVVGRLLKFLGSQSEIMDHVGSSGNSGPTRALLSACEQLAARWKGTGPAEQCNMMRAIVRRVVFHSNKLELFISEREILKQISSSVATTSLPKSAGNADLIRIETNCQLLRNRGQVRLLVPGPGNESQDQRTNLPLVKALVRAHEWSRRILDGGASSNADLAAKVGLSEEYVSKVTDCAFLAPDIVEAILDGRQPKELTFAKLRRHVPLDWGEQRRLFGFLRSL